MQVTAVRPAQFLGGVATYEKELLLQTGWEWVSWKEFEGGLITAVHWNHFFPVELFHRLKEKIVLVTHDLGNRADWTWLSLIKNSGIRNLTIRETVRDRLIGMGIPCKFIRHPYTPTHPRRKELFRAICISRLDGRKHIDWIVKANRLGADIMLCGSDEYRLFIHHQLDKRYPDWRKWYRGRQTMSGAEHAATARWVVDLTTIRQDGGGTQYTTLEAWDAGSGLIVHKDWIIPGGLLQHGVNCIAVGSPEELADWVKRDVPRQIIDNGYQLVGQFNVRSEYEGLFRSEVQ